MDERGRLRSRLVGIFVRKHAPAVLEQGTKLKFADNHVSFRCHRYARAKIEMVCAIARRRSFLEIVLRRVGRNDRENRCVPIRPDLKLAKDLNHTLEV